MYPLGGVLFDGTKPFKALVFKADLIKKGPYNKLISMLSRFIADKGRAFSPAFRLLDVDRYSIPILITIKTLLKSLIHEKNKLSESY